MNFPIINGNDELKEKIFRAILNGEFTHACMISGPEEAERHRLADAIAAALVCSGGEKPCGMCSHCKKARLGLHPDIRIIDREKDAILVDQIRQMKRDAVVLPNEAEKKVYIVTNADTMNTAAQNAALKLLEGPPSYVHVLLALQNPLSMLPTVRSRCVEFAMEYPDESAGSDNPAAETYLNLLCRKDEMELALFCNSLERVNKQILAEFVHGVPQMLTAYFGKENGFSAEETIRIADLFKRLAEMMSANVRPGHIVGLLAAEGF